MEAARGPGRRPLRVGAACHPSSMTIATPPRPNTHAGAVAACLAGAAVLGVGLAVFRYLLIWQAISDCADEPSQVLEAGGRFALLFETVVRAVGYPLLLCVPVLVCALAEKASPRPRPWRFMAWVGGTVLMLAAAGFYLDFTMSWSYLKDYGSDIGNEMRYRCSGDWPW